MDAKQLREQSEHLFTKKRELDVLHQEIAEQFYPQRADFTIHRDVGDEFADHLMTSYPVLARRDLGDQLGTMLRPTAKTWFHMVPRDEGRENNESRRWLEWAAALMRRAMYDPASLFTRAVKEGDHDFASFGQTVISVELNQRADALLYRCWHLRDCAWMEDENGQICAIFRKWKPTLRTLTRLYPGKLRQDVVDRAKKAPFEETDCLHMVVAADLYDGDAKGRPWWSIHYDCAHDAVLEATPSWTKRYVIPRWQTCGSQYAYSPATIIALPDARLIQAMSSTLLEAGERLANPPMVATQNAVRSDIALFPGGTTWVDDEYDERLGDALRPITQEARGMPFTFQIQGDVRAIIASAFYLDKLTLPQRAPEMTAYEVGQRVAEYIRNAMPIFEPMESEYNGSVCEETFDLLLRNRAFGDPRMMPRVLRGADVTFRFESPLHDAIEAQKGHKLMEAKALLAEAVALDRSAASMIDVKVALRDALSGVGVPAKWMRSEANVAEMDRMMQQAEEAQKLLASMQAGSEVAANLAGAGKDMAGAQAVATS